MLRRFVILAGGDQWRLRHVLIDFPKQLIPFRGEPLLKRTLRLMGWPPTTVVCNNERWQKYFQHLEQTAHHPAAARLGDSIPFNGTFGEAITIALLGDVVWHPADLGRVCAADHDAVWGHPDGNRFTAKPYPELMAITVTPRRLIDLAGARALRELAARARFPVRSLEGWTDDIDTEEDYRVRLPILEKLSREENL